MKLVQKGNLNMGITVFIRDREFIGRIAVQQKPIKWQRWDLNELFNITVKPSLLRLRDGDTLDEWEKSQPYSIYIDSQNYTTAPDWKQVLDFADYRLGLVCDRLGLKKLDIVNGFIKNEPKITFSEVHEILKKLDVV